MQPDAQELSESYRKLSETEIASLHAEVATLTDVARRALLAEIQRRGLSDAHLSKLHFAELRHEAKFDRRQKQHRKSVTSYILFRGDAKGTITILLLALGVILVAWLVSLFRS
jgi:hypothetical protein